LESKTIFTQSRKERKVSVKNTLICMVFFAFFAPLRETLLPETKKGCDKRTPFELRR